MLFLPAILSLYTYYVKLPTMNYIKIMKQLNFTLLFQIVISRLFIYFSIAFLENAT